jgi:hypothetical protein
MALPRRKSVRLASAAFAAALGALLTGCAAGGLTGGGPAQPAPTAAPADMAGRWALTAMGSTCAINLASGAGASEGAIRPEGGCGGNFYTARKWSFENSALVLRDHTGKPLAQLSLLAPGRFEGQSSAGAQHISLVR